MTQLNGLNQLPLDNRPGPERKKGDRDAYLHPACEDTRTCPRCVEMRTSTLAVTLQVAVPLWIAEANQRTGETRAELLAAWREEASPVICARADIILYTGGKRGDAAKAFNSLARGMAALACHRGGFNAFGLLWCAEHSPAGKPVAAFDPVCVRCFDRYPDKAGLADAASPTVVEIAPTRRQGDSRTEPIRDSGGQMELDLGEAAG